MVNYFLLVKTRREKSKQSLEGEAASKCCRRGDHGVFIALQKRPHLIGCRWSPPPPPLLSSCVPAYTWMFKLSSSRKAFATGETSVWVFWSNTLCFWTGKGCLSSAGMSLWITQIWERKGHKQSFSCVVEYRDRFPLNKQQIPRLYKSHRYQKSLKLNPLLLFMS